MKQKNLLFIIVISIIFLWVLPYLIFTKPHSEKGDRGNQAKENLPTTSTEKDNLELTTKINPDLLPLFSTINNEISWQRAETEKFDFGETTYEGVKLTTNSIFANLDPSSIFLPFEKYYEQKLTALGWERDNDFDAGGPMGGQTGYTKDGKLILTSFSISFENKPVDTPLECPCSLTLSVFSN